MDTSVPANAVFAGFGINWGKWNATSETPATLQPDALDGTKVDNVTDTVFWITAAPTPTAAMPTGTFTYATVLGFQGKGEAGDVTAFGMNMNATLNLGTGTISTGTMSVQNGPRASGFQDQWVADLTNGTFTSGQLNVNVTNGSVLVDGLPQGSPTGTVKGSLTGPNGEGLAGAFNLQQGTSNHVEGTFMVRQ